MSLPRSLRARIVLACFGIGAGLSVLFGALVLLALEAVEHDQVDRLLVGELETIAARHASDAAPALPQTALLRAWIATAHDPGELPGSLRGLRPGISEVVLLGDAHRVAVIARGPWRYLLAFNVQAIEEWEIRIRWVVLAIAGISTGLAALLGIALSNRVVEPLACLVREVEGREPRAAGGTFAARHADDEIGHLAAALDGYEQRLSAYAARERDFTHFASHELRTPLAVLASGTEVLLARDGLSAPDRDRVSRIDRTARAMTETVEALLALARVESGGAPPRPEDARAVLDEVVEECRPLVGGREVKIDVDVAGAPFPAAIPGALRLVMRNLIGNACAYTRRGTVSVRVGPAGLDVVDTGPGFDAGGDASPRGPGLGLAIVRRVCERSGWDLDVRGTGAGTHVRVGFGPGAESSRPAGSSPG